jgi:membrane dipeptidase
MKFLTLIFISSLTLFACSTLHKTNNRQKADSNEARADALAHKFIIVDGHVDLPYRLRIQNFKLEREYLDIPIETDKGDFDYKRAKVGGLDAPFMSIFIPASYQDGRAKLLADSLIDMIQGMATQLPDKFNIVSTPAEIESNFKKGIISLPMGMENGAPIEGDLNNVAYFRSKGISYITLTHSKDNHICDSSYDSTGTWKGLSPFGHTLIPEMNKHGIMIDISHVSDRTFYQVLEITQVPVIASHSSCRKYTPGFERNMDDDMLKALAKNGGVIQINFGSSFLDKRVVDQQNEDRNALNTLLEEKGLARNDEAAKAIIKQFEKDHPTLYSDVKMVANHIEHVVEIAGIDHVGLGSDFDGVGDSLPVGLKDVSAYPNLLAELLNRGFSDEDIEKICSKNVFRVWNKVLAFAE